MILMDAHQSASYANALINYELKVILSNTVLAFEVPGVPEGQGSKTMEHKGGKTWMHEDNPRLKPWRDSVTVHARQAKAQARLTTINGPVYARALFVLPRPKDHFRTGRFAGEIKPGKPRWHNVQDRDTDKLQRAIGDALKAARVLIDDGLIAMWHAGKVWQNPGEPLGATIRIDLL
jgi:Holliday junction resolvase RusA-like endonuclease